MSGTSLFFLPPPRETSIAKTIIGIRDRIEAINVPLSADVDEFASLLTSHRSVVSVDLMDEATKTCVMHLARVLDRHCVPHLGYWPSQQREGRLLPGGYVCRLPRMCKTVIRPFPIEEGEPTPLEEDLLAAGFEVEEVQEIGRLFYGGSVEAEPELMLG